MGKFSKMQYISRAMETLGESSALLVTGKDKSNVMTIGWGTAGVIWGKNIFMVMVRKSRYTWGLLEAHPEFTVFVPYEDMKKQIGVCGRESGRNTDKTALCGFTLLPSKTVAVPHIKGRGVTFECKVVFKTDMDRKLLEEASAAKFYSGADSENMHTLYFGEITEAYES